MPQERYIPTRLEWLVVSMQARVPMVLSQMRRLHGTESPDDVRVFFTAKDPDSVVVAVRSVKSVPETLVQYLQQEIGREVDEFVRQHGWENWAKIEWDVR